MIESLAILFHRLGPYHAARLRAAVRNGRGAVSAVELCAGSREYAWEAVDISGLTRTAVYDAADTGSLSRDAVFRTMAAALDRLKPSALAIGGWSDPGMLAAMQWALRTRTPMLVMSESQAGDFPRSALREFVKRRLVGSFGAGLVGGQPHADYLASLGIPREAIFHGYDVVDNAHFVEGSDAARERSETLRAELGLPFRYFLASNRFIEKKNLPLLLDSYRRYRKLAGDCCWSLVLLGDGILRPALEAQIVRYDLGRHVLLPGFKQYPSLPAYYGLAGAFIHASTTEQWGLVVNEAMASALPVIVSKTCGCASDLVVPGVTGETFDPADPEELAQHMLRFSSQPERSLEMGLAGRKRIAAWSPDLFGVNIWRAADAAARRIRSDRTGLRAAMIERLAR